EDQRFAVWRPVGVRRVGCTSIDQFGRAALGGNHIDLPGFAGRMTKEGDLLPVRRPSRQVSQHGRKDKLQLLGSVYLTPPHGAIGAIIVGDPLSITGEVESHRRDSRKVRGELS